MIEKINEWLDEQQNKRKGEQMMKIRMDTDFLGFISNFISVARARAYSIEMWDHTWFHTQYKNKNNKIKLMICVYMAAHILNSPYLDWDWYDQCTISAF